MVKVWVLKFIERYFSEFSVIFLLSLSVIFGFLLQNLQDEPPYIADVKNSQLAAIESMKNVTPTPKPNIGAWTYLKDCQYKQKLPIYDEKGNQPEIIFCPQYIFIDFPPVITSILGTFSLEGEDILLDSVDTEPRLFYDQRLEMDKDRRLPQYMEINPVDSDSLLLTIKSYDDTTQWSSNNTSIYLVSFGRVKKIYRYTANHVGGVSIVSTSPITLKEHFLIGNLGCGACYYEWDEFYEWHEGKHPTLELANNLHTSDFKELLEYYEKKNKTECSNYSNKTLETLYFEAVEYDLSQEDKFSTYVCSADASAPATSILQAEHFLKAREAIKRIINGENLSDRDIDSIELVK